VKPAHRLEPILGAGQSRDAPDAYRLDDALQGLLAKRGILECPARQPMGRVGDDDLIRPRQRLNAGRKVGRLTYRKLRYRGVARTCLAHHHRTGGNAHAHLKRHRCLDLFDRLDNL
jgi:hypothetical protein